jgi:hypothetical protein
VRGAEQDEVSEVGGSALRPGDHVVDGAPFRAAVAAGVGASLVAQGQGVPSPSPAFRRQLDPVGNAGRSVAFTCPQWSDRECRSGPVIDSVRCVVGMSLRMPPRGCRGVIDEADAWSMRATNRPTAPPGTIVSGETVRIAACRRLWSSSQVWRGGVGRDRARQPPRGEAMVGFGGRRGVLVLGRSPGSASIRPGLGRRAPQRWTAALSGPSTAPPGTCLAGLWHRRGRVGTAAAGERGAAVGVVFFCTGSAPPTPADRCRG